MNDHELDSKIAMMKERTAELRDKIVGSTEEFNEEEREFREIQGICNTLIHEFKEANFRTKVAPNQSYDEHTVFTEGNITSYLSELEEYIASLITYTAHKKGDPNASTSSVPFNALTNKDWLARDMAIDAPYDITMRTTDDNGEEEDAVLDVDTLYKRFQEKLEKNLIQCNRKAEVKGNQPARDD